MATENKAGLETQPAGARTMRGVYLAVVLLASAVYLGCIISPPSLMDDVDAVQAQISRNMIASGDWVTARLDGVTYLEKAPLIYWLMAGSYEVFGAHDWAARIPVALSAIALCLLTAAFGAWAFGKKAGLYAGVCMSTCVGLFLFTRILIPDALLTLTIGLALWAFMRALDEDERHPRLWAAVLAASLGTGLLVKSVIALAFPVCIALIYLALTKQLFLRKTWNRLHVFSGLLILLAIAAPWHVLATLRNPPYFVFTLHSGPGQYHGFLWFFFINEQLLRFLNLRYPRDYNTVPRVWFWLLHLVWLFPWSVYFPAVAKLSFRPVDRAGRVRLLALCWAGFILVFFTFSTTQEYYSMPCYPALALLLGCAMATESAWTRWGTRALCVVCACAAIAVFAILFHVRGLPTPGDISSALSHHPKAYTLSLGHMQDLTLESFAYLRLPLLLAGIAFLVGVAGTFRGTARRAFVAAALMMVLFFHAARLAMVVFDPYLSSRPLAEALLRSPDGKLIVDHHYYFFSSVFFYTNRTALLLNGRYNTVEYGSYAPGAPNVFINDAQFKDLWLQPQRYYVVADQSAVARFTALVGAANLNVVMTSGGKTLLTNEPLASSARLQKPADVQALNP
jgi:4-amino-4-deoxy-L-arabinose transferase-like glycosyltransferase